MTLNKLFYLPLSLDFLSVKGLITNLNFVGKIKWGHECIAPIPSTDWRVQSMTIVEVVFVVCSGE